MAEPDKYKNKLADTMRIDIRPEDVQKEKGKKKIYIQRNRKEPDDNRPEIEGDETGKKCKRLGGPAFQKLLHNIYDAVLVADMDGVILNANERASIFFRCDVGYLCAYNVANLISGADSTLIPTILKNLEQDRFTLIQASCIRKDGSTFPTEISANRIDLSGQQCISFFIRDITLRKSQEEQLRTGYYAIQNSGGGIAITGKDFKLTYSNPAMQRLLGAESAEDLKGANLADFCVDKKCDEALEKLQDSSSWNGELEIAGLNDERSYVHVNIVKNINTENILTGYIFSFMDVSRERQAKLKLEAYAAELSHKNEEMKKDLEMARDIQRALLPRKYPKYSAKEGGPPLLDFSHIYIPSGTIGGDFFDVIDLSDSHVGLFMADVSGHGMRAALITATLRGIVEEMALDSDSPSEFMRKINYAYTSIFEITDDFSFVTAIYAVLDVHTGNVKLSFAGHPGPIVIRSTGKARQIDFQTEGNSPAIGLLGSRDVDFQDYELRLDSGDTIFLYTDGIFEEESQAREEYGQCRLVERLSNCGAKPLDDILDGIVSDVRRVTDKKEFVDDVCMLAVAYDRERALKT